MNSAVKFNFGAFVEGDFILIDYGDKIKGYSVKSKKYTRLEILIYWMVITKLMILFIH